VFSAIRGIFFLRWGRGSNSGQFITRIGFVHQNFNHDARKKMSANLTTESLRPLIGLLESKLGKRPSPATVWRWTAKGVRVGDRRVKLEAVRVGQSLFSTSEAVERFIERQNESAPSDEQPVERSDVTRRRLKEAGLLK
jgi:hypothetical protein